MTYTVQFPGLLRGVKGLDLLIQYHYPEHTPSRLISEVKLDGSISSYLAVTVVAIFCECHHAGCY